MIKKFSIITVFLIVSTFAFGQYKQAALWSSVQGQFPLQKKLDAKIEAGYRLTNNFQNTDKYYAETGLEFKFNKYLGIGGEYRFSEKYKQEDDYFAERHRLMIKMKTGYKIKSFGFSWAIKIQTSFFDPTEHDWNTTKQISHLRNKFQIKYGKKSSIITPFVFYELFIPLNSSADYYIQSESFRAASGIEFKINKTNSIKTFFMFEEEKDDPLIYQNYIYGLSYSVEF